MMITLAAWLGMAATCFVAAILQATNGFGFAVLAVPFFLVLAPPGDAIPIIIIISLATSLLVMRRLYRWVDPALLCRLTIGAFTALPLGLFAFAHADQAVVGAAAGTIVTFFAVMLARHRWRGGETRIARSPARDWGVGMVAGIATGLVGMAGPPPLIYLMLARAPMPTVRATLIAFFCLIYAVTVTANTAFVGMPHEAWPIAASLIPFIWVGGRIGLRVGERIGERRAAALAIAVLAATGLYTLAAALHSALWS